VNRPQEHSLVPGEKRNQSRGVSGRGRTIRPPGQLDECDERHCHRDRIATNAW